MLEALDEVGTASFFRWGSLLIAQYRDVTLADQITRWGELQRQQVAHTGRFGTLTFVTSASIRASDEVRGHARAMADEFKSTARANAVVVPERSLSAAAFRSILTGISLASRSTVPQSTFRDTREALAWLAEHGVLPNAEVDAAAAAIESATNAG